MPTVLPLCWPGRCTPKVPAECASVPLLKKVSLGATANRSPCLAFHILQLSGKSRFYPGHSQSQITSFPSSRCQQDPLNSLALPGLVTTDPVWIHHSLCSLPFFFPSATLCIQVSPVRCLEFLHPGRRESCWATIIELALLQCPCCSRNFWCQTPGTSVVGL